MASLWGDKELTQCQGHDTRKKATQQCKNCEKPLCNSCMETHLEIFDECRKNHLKKEIMRY